MASAEARGARTSHASFTVKWGTVNSIAGRRAGTTSKSTGPAADNLRSDTSRVGKGRRG